MGQTIVLWEQRFDGLNVTLTSPVIDASSARDMTLMGSAVLGAGGVTIQGQHSATPDDPGSWLNIGAAVALALPSAVGVIGGYNLGTTVAMGPYVRYVATVLAGVTWNASVVVRD